MMRIFHIVLFAFAIFALGCKSTQDMSQTAAEDDSPVLLSFDQEKVTKAEFERVYQKNNGGYAAAKNHSDEQYEEYLDLYIKFKRKVFEAEAEGLDTTRAFKQEFETYRRQLAQPYLAAKDVEERLINEAYERSKFVLNANHLLVNVAEDAAPADTLAAYQRIMSYRDSILKQGQDFAEMAARHSDDPSAAQNQGNLGFFSVFDMVYPFESRAFNTPVGKVSMPVRTRFGYHLIKVNDKLISGGTKRAAHIIIRTGERYSANDSTEAQAMIQEIYTKLKAGADFAELAREYSDDPSTSNRGGDLGSGRLLPVMEEIKLRLNEGEVSAPFTTRFGWHILKVTEASGIKPLDESEAELRRRIERDTRSQIGRTALINRIKTDYGFQMNEANFNEFKGSLNANFPRGTWTPADSLQELYSKPLFSLTAAKGYQRSLQDLVKYYQKTRPRNPRLNALQAADQVLKNFVEKELIAYEEEQLPKKNPEYRYLLKEYRDGILLFTLMEKMVWKKAVEDTIGLENYYDAHQEDFYADRMIAIREYKSTDETTINKVNQLLKLNATDSEIDSLVSRESALQLSIRSLEYEEGDPDADPEWFKESEGYVSGIIRTGDGFKIIRITEVIPAGVQPLEKVKSEAITKYQDYLEQEWLKDLEYKYPVSVNEEVFQQLFDE
jgi:peptidyl-prolyl cis-trans isomerase SurA